MTLMTLVAVLLLLGQLLGPEQLLKLAAGMKMNTDARTGSVCGYHGQRDCAEASEKLLRLPVKVCMPTRHAEGMPI